MQQNLKKLSQNFRYNRVSKLEEHLDEFSEFLDDQVTTTTAKNRKVLPRTFLQGSCCCFVEIGQAILTVKKNQTFTISLRRLHDQDLVRWISREYKRKHTLPDIRNKSLKIMGLQVLFKMVQNMQCSVI